MALYFRARLGPIHYVTRIDGPPPPPREPVVRPEDYPPECLPLRPSSRWSSVRLVFALVAVAIALVTVSLLLG